MPISHKFILLSAGAFALHLVQRRRRSAADKERSKQQRRNEPKSPVVHAFTSESSEVSVPVVSLQQKPDTWGGAVVQLLASGGIIAAAIAAALREQYDLVAILSVAWALVLLGQVLQWRHWQPVRNSSGASQDADIQVEVTDAEPLKIPDLSGTWIKDNTASQSMEDAMRLMQLNGMLRTAVRLIKGMKIELDAQQFQFGVFSVISWFKITERYTLGEAAQHRRRDFRRGKSTGVARITPWGSVRLEYDWNSPLSGRGVDEFTIDEQGRLKVEATIHVGTQTASYTLVYNRKR